MKLSYRNATQALPDLMSEVLRNGETIDSRNGLTKELSMVQVELTQPWPLTITAPGRNVSIAAQIAETMWVLSGRNDVEWLSHYLPQAPKFSDDGKTWRGGYGPRIRRWEGTGAGYDGYVDQLEHVIRLLTDEPESRRAVINIYDPWVDTDPGKDIPCNNWLHFLSRKGKLDLHIAIRSNDLMWGWSGINAFEWGALLTVVAGLTGLERGRLTFSISSLHLYDRHWEKAKAIAATRGSAPRHYKQDPDFQMPTGMSLDFLLGAWFELEHDIRLGGVDRATLLERINIFPEPMLRSWLQVLLSWWHQDQMDVCPAVKGTALGYAVEHAPKPKSKPEPLTDPRATQDPFEALSALADAEDARQKQQADAMGTFIHEADTLHREKDAAYGASWMKRGEQMAIMANIARKVDRLGKDGGGDTSYDTALDLMVYLAKYSSYLQDGYATPKHSTGTAHCDRVLRFIWDAARSTERNGCLTQTVGVLESRIARGLDMLEDLVIRNQPRADQVSKLNGLALALAFKLWTPPAPKDADTAKAEWVEGNATRFFNGYNDTEGA